MPVNWKMTELRVICNLKEGYDCPVCDNHHDNDNLYITPNEKSLTLNCFSNREKRNNKTNIEPVPL